MRTRKLKNYLITSNLNDVPIILLNIAISHYAGLNFIFLNKNINYDYVDYVNLFFKKIAYKHGAIREEYESYSDNIPMLKLVLINNCRKTIDYLNGFFKKYAVKLLHNRQKAKNEYEEIMPLLLNEYDKFLINNWRNK